ncbi:DMT family transporter [Sphingomonas sp.]|uniref:DMT family transporter n=1 Tax=Sphingomonas sp. TaxID=28214 RepID=UPI000DB532E5|nr:DMT family transporter [Sphingomonas sp.]PZU08612.1 MAG: permease [Sphingomonas sp.]
MSEPAIGGAERARIYGLLIFVTLLWAGNSIVARAIHTDIPPFTLALFRWTGALLLLLPFAMRHVRADRAEIARSWPIILLIGAVGVGCFNALLYSGLQYTTATNGLLIQAAIPALVLLLNRLFFGVRARLAEIVGVLMAAAGVLTIIFRADPAALLGLEFGRGDALVLGAVVMWGLYTAFLRLRPPIHPLSLIATTFLIGVIVMLPFSIWELGHRPLRLNEGVLLGIGYVAIFPSIIAYMLYNQAVAEIGAGAAGQMISLQPLFGALLAALLLSEPLHPYHFAGMALIVGGIVLPIVTRPRE